MSETRQAALEALASRPMWRSETFNLEHAILGGRCEVHIFPEQDSSPHLIEVGGMEQICECGVEETMNEYGAYLYIHSSFDGRHIIEEVESGAQAQ